MDRGYSTHNRHLMDDSLGNHEDQQVLTQLKKAYWTKKQQIMQTIGKKEDQHVVASDAELDAKLELFKQIQISCVDLLRVILAYQKRLLVLAKEENAMGKFLKHQSEEDSTQAGKMMRAVGQSQGFSAQQRIQLRQPLYRLFQEVETFRQQAVADTQLTVKKMEEARTKYRGALLWMKDVSEQLDPDAYNRLEKFRLVQSQVRKAKDLFDKHKLDVLQKVDLLAASRGNMFSHALAAYQNSLLLFWKKTSKTMNAVSETFKGFQYYEFNMLKNDLDEAARDLADQTASEKADELLQSLLKDTGHDPTSEEDKLIYEIIMSLKDKKTADEEKRSSRGHPDESRPQDDRSHGQARAKRKSPVRKQSADSTTGLIDFEEDGFVDDDIGEQFGEFQAAMDKESQEFSLLSEDDKYAVFRQDNDELLDDIFGPDQSALHKVAELKLSGEHNKSGGDMFLPSDLLDTDLEGLELQGSTAASQMNTQAGFPAAHAANGQMQASARPAPPPYQSQQGATGANASTKAEKLPTQSKAASKQPISSWYNLFADLDPLQDPDAIGKKNQDSSGCA